MKQETTNNEKQIKKQSMKQKPQTTTKNKFTSRNNQQIKSSNK